MYDVIALGELLVDFAPVSTDGEGYPTLKANPGGAPGNFLAALSRYGARTAFVGKVGQDAFGRLLTDTLERAGIETKGVIADPEAFTTLAFVTLDEHGDRSFSFARKPGADTRLRPEEVDLELILQCRLFHFGTLSLTEQPARVRHSGGGSPRQSAGQMGQLRPQSAPAPVGQPGGSQRADAVGGIPGGHRQDQ